jgi:hypothetical protein
MLPLSNDTWDIQFQTDHPEVLDYNIGWYFAKATNQTFEFFNRSYMRWQETQQWDQFVMWEIGHIMEFEESPLRVHRLNLTHYKVRWSTFGSLTFTERARTLCFTAWNIRLADIIPHKILSANPP